jgi:glycosyltransferase involved in cell wall biosynthesis
MKISCIIPTYDRADMLGQTIESILGQTKIPDEIIVVDNGKNDTHLSSKFDKYVKMIRLPAGSGVSKARNAGAETAAHEILTFLDDDDLWGQEYLENVANAFEKGADCVVSRLDKLTNGKILPHKNAAGLISIENILMFNPGITGSNIAIKKNIFLSLGGYDPKLPPSEDKSLVLELLLKKTVNIVTLSDNQAIQRQHDGERISAPRHLAIGVSSFTKKYRYLMDAPTYLFNRWKYFKARFEAGDKMAFIGLIVYSLIYRTAKFFYFK